MRVLTLVTINSPRPSREEMRKWERADEQPRTLLYEDVLQSDILAEGFLRGAPRSRRILYSLLPATFSQAIEAVCVRRTYDAIITWSAPHAIMVALLLKLMRRRHPHITLLSWISKPKKAIPLKLVESHIDRFVLWSSVQRDFALNEMRIPAEKVVFVGRRVDHEFWRPLDVKSDMICSAGQEMRDFPTLIEAMRGLNIKCHIATGELSGKMFRTVETVMKYKDLPENVTVGKLTPAELRMLYARSRFIVMPLLESDTDNGITVITQAMAMGKAVICSRTRGQVDILTDFETGLYVPPGDPAALREAIRYLWENPEVAATMGRNARLFIEQSHTFDIFVDGVKKIVEDVVEEYHDGRAARKALHEPAPRVRGPRLFKTLTLVSAGIVKPVMFELLRRERQDESPRVSLYERALNSDLLDEKYLARAAGFETVLFPIVPVYAAQVLEAFAVRHEYSAVISWAEHLGIPFAALLKLRGERYPHVAIFSWVSRPKKAIALRAVQRYFSRIILMSTVQRDYAVQRIGIESARIALLKWPVDEKFWRPLNRPADMICAVGREMRDYGTLLKALGGFSVPCHIAAGGLVEGKKDEWNRVLKEEGLRIPNVTVGRKNPAELRELYARSRFAVVPLLPTETDNGTTSILEAMAMGKAVVCTRVEGQRDVIQDGVTGILVEPENPRALKEAIEYLWTHPEEADRMGSEGRRWVEQNHSLEGWVSEVKRIVVEVVEEARIGNQR